ncbi:DegV family protein [Niallia endozanthoxylica]|uniref:DegV family protein n=1 Tax=Niallia endozanthoxylica TaxID=2036016 RepID=A0A5J5HLI9_9BACI|nr:DegV family protein [Niallia endozanthoxylica]KAA9021694.1 DegV family protein [Niallia endozanthoxylica]
MTNKIKIVTDSTVDLTQEELDKYGIEVVPLTISINGETYTDRVDISPSEFMGKMKVSQELPKSSQPSAGAFVELYDRLGSQGYEVLSIHMTGGMSGTAQSAESASKMTETNVTVVDSRFISKALSFQVVVAATMALDGKDVQAILNRLDEIRNNTRLFVVVDTLENLVKGGRIGKGKAIIGSLLNIKPIASLENGEYTPVAKVRSHAQVAKYLAARFAEDTKGKIIKGVGLVHADGYELASKTKKAIFETTGFEDISIEETTPIVSTHTGPGAIGFMYYFE